MRAILSVSDKTGLVPFAQSLAELGWELVSTGGTKKALAEGGVPVKGISEITGFPEIMDGRVKTLHPAVHGGILARRDVPEHLEQLVAQGFERIDLVVVNLYPFFKTVTGGDVDMQTALENIDIGGPAMIRASAKNFPDVIVVVDPADYDTVLEKLRAGEVGDITRRRLAQKAFQHVASYDTAIAEYLHSPEDEAFPQHLTVALEKVADLRYGENPHQAAAFYRDVSVDPGEPFGVTTATQLHGKELSYNNILDADAAWRAASAFTGQAIAIVKHNNPCGLAVHDDQVTAYERALAGDPVSAFGGIVAVNRPLTAATAEVMAKTFYEIVIAPDFEPAALDLLQKKRDLRILRLADSREPRWDYRRVSGGLLVQDADTLDDDALELKVVSNRQPTGQELSDLRFAWKAAKLVKSNAIVFAKDNRLVGMGAGQPNRLVSVHLAARAAGDEAKGCVLASDAFFPFADGIKLGIEAGVTAVIQPGGSIRDQEVIDAANEAGIAMVFTGHRHFRH